MAAGREHLRWRALAHEFVTGVAAEPGCRHMFVVERMLRGMLVDGDGDGDCESSDVVVCGEV